VDWLFYLVFIWYCPVQIRFFIQMRFKLATIRNLVQCWAILSIQWRIRECSIYKFTQGRRNDVKARGADFRERALLNWYFLRDVCKTSGVELRLIMFSIYWMIGVWGGSPPGDCAILEARWLHSCVFWSKFVKELHWQFATIR
jgi:hypothetical protein